MDPKAVMNMVREQKKHINDAYSTQPNKQHQQQPTSLSNSSPVSSLNNSSSFSSNNNFYHQSSNLQLKTNTNNSINNYSNIYNNNSNKRADQLPIHLIQPKSSSSFTPQSNTLNNNQKLYNDKINKIINNSNLSCANTANSVNLPTQLNKPGFKQINDYYNDNKNSFNITNPPPRLQHSHLVNPNNFNSNISHLQDLHSSINPNQLIHQSRSGSVKSTASDSGVGSTSPLSDCSDYGGANNGQAFQRNNDLNKPKQQKFLTPTTSSIIMSNNSNKDILNQHMFQHYLDNDPSALFNSNNPYGFNNLNNEQISAIINSRKRKNNPVNNVYDDFVLNKYSNNSIPSKYGLNNNFNMSERSSSVANLNNNIKNINFNDIHHSSSHHFHHQNNFNSINNNCINNSNKNLIKCDDKFCNGCLVNNNIHHNMKSPINTNASTSLPPQILNCLPKHNHNMMSPNKQISHQPLTSPHSYQSTMQHASPPTPITHCDCSECQMIYKTLNQKISSAPSMHHQYSTHIFSQPPPTTNSPCDCQTCNAALLQQHQQQFKIHHSRNISINNNNNNNVNNDNNNNNNNNIINNKINNNYAKQHSITPILSAHLNEFKTSKLEPPPQPPSQLSESKKPSFCSCAECQAHLLATGKLTNNDIINNNNAKSMIPSTNNDNQMKLANTSTTQLANILHQSSNQSNKNDIYNLNNKLITDSKNLSYTTDQYKLSLPKYQQSKTQQNSMLGNQQQSKIHKPVPIIATPVPIKPKLYTSNTQQQQHQTNISSKVPQTDLSRFNNNNISSQNNNNLLVSQPPPTLTSNAVILTHESDELMNNGLHIIKLKNNFYNSGKSLNDNDNRINNDTNTEKESQSPVSNSPMVIGKRKHSTESPSTSPSNDSSDKSSDKSVKRVATMNYLMQKLNSDGNEFKAKRISPPLNESNNSNFSIKTIEDTDNDIELGEVIQLNNSNDELLSNSKKTLVNENEPVTLSKKIIPFVRPRIIDWLEKCVEIAHKLTKKSNFSHETGLDLLKKSWPRLLLTYMIENNFEFCVTKDYSSNTNCNSEDVNTKDNNDESSSTKTNDKNDSNEFNKNNNNSCDVPKEKHANELNNIISSGSSFQLNIDELDRLREFILLSEDNDETTIQQSLLDLKNIFETNHNNNKEQFTLLLSFLPSIYNVRASIINNLFCSNLNSSYGKTVDEFIDKKYTILNEEK